MSWSHWQEHRGQHREALAAIRQERATADSLNASLEPMQVVEDMLRDRHGREPARRRIMELLL